jgi:hypothetical protein
MLIVVLLRACYKKEGALPYYISKVGPYKGYMFSTRERDWFPLVVVVGPP